MAQASPQWKSLGSIKELDHLVGESQYKPALVFKYDASSTLSAKIKAEIETEWDLPLDQVSLFIVDSKQESVTSKVSDLAGIEDVAPQVVLFADGVTMYDESGELISFKKIKLALKIVHRTFRWMETRA